MPKAHATKTNGKVPHTDQLHWHVADTHAKVPTALWRLASTDHQEHLAFTKDITMSQRIEIKMAMKGGHLHRRCMATTKSPEERHHVLMVRCCGHPSLGNELHTSGQCRPMATASSMEPSTQWPTTAPTRIKAPAKATMVMQMRTKETAPPTAKGNGRAVRGNNNFLCTEA